MMRGSSRPTQTWSQSPRNVCGVWQPFPLGKSGNLSPTTAKMVMKIEKNNKRCICSKRTMEQPTYRTKFWKLKNCPTCTNGLSARLRGFLSVRGVESLPGLQQVDESVLFASQVSTQQQEMTYPSYLLILLAWKRTHQKPRMFLRADVPDGPSTQVYKVSKTPHPALTRTRTYSSAEGTVDHPPLTPNFILAP